MPNQRNATQPQSSQLQPLPRNIYDLSSARAKRDLRRSSKLEIDLAKRARELEQYVHNPQDLDSSDSLVQPSLFASEFDVIEELSFNRERYTAYGDSKAQVTIYGVPSLVSYNIERLQQKIQPKIGTHPIVACCASYGVVQLYKNNHTRDLGDFREALLDDSIANNETIGRDLLEFYSLLKSFKIEIPDDSGGLRSEKSNYLIPEWLDQNLGGLASRLGAPKSSLMIICIMYTLATQESTPKYQKKQLMRAIDIFLCRVEFRKQIASLLLKAAQAK